MYKQIEAAVAAIFKDYEDSPELQDLKEEITANLADRIDDMVKSGTDRQEALKTALDELGDITEAADSISRQKRKEIIGQAYRSGVPMDKLHAAGYAAAGLILAFGIICGCIVGFSSGYVMKFLAALLPFAVISVGAFVFLGLTHETKTHHPMSYKRSMAYSGASMLLTFGGFISGILLFKELAFSDLTSLSSLTNTKFSTIYFNPAASLGALIPFVIPALAILAFLIFTEKTRKKPWVLKMEEEQMEMYSQEFGMLTGALWIFAFALFALISILAGFHLSWIVFLFTVAVQMLINYFFMKKNTPRQAREV